MIRSLFFSSSCWQLNRKKVRQGTKIPIPVFFIAKVFNGHKDIKMLLSLIINKDPLMIYEDGNLFNSGFFTSPFQQEDIPPFVIHLAYLFSYSDNPESILFMQFDTRNIFREYACL